jgi:hypothetical protein
LLEHRAVPQEPFQGFLSLLGVVDEDRNTSVRSWPRSSTLQIGLSTRGSEPASAAPRRVRSDDAGTLIPSRAAISRVRALSSAVCKASGAGSTASLRSGSDSGKRAR